MIAISSNMAVIRKRHKVFTIFLMIVYLAFLFYFLFFAEDMGRTADISYQYNLVPFQEIRRFLRMIQIPQWRMAGLLNLAGNIIAFMPFAAFSSVLIHPKERWYLITLLSFELSLCVEIIQLIAHLGCFDVDDLILNTLGGLLGYWVYRIWKHFVI